MEAHGSPWQPMDAHGSPWQPMEAYGSQWQPMAAHDTEIRCSVLKVQKCRSFVRPMNVLLIGTNFGRKFGLENY